MHSKYQKNKCNIKFVNIYLKLFFIPKFCIFKILSLENKNKKGLLDMFLFPFSIKNKEPKKTRKSMLS